MDRIVSTTSPSYPSVFKHAEQTLQSLGFTEAQLTSEEHSKRRDWLLGHVADAERLSKEGGLSPEEMLTLPEEMFQIFVENPRMRAVLQCAGFDIHDSQIAKLFGTDLGKKLLSDFKKLLDVKSLLRSGTATPTQLLEPGYIDNMLYWIHPELRLRYELPQQLANMDMTVENLVEWMSGPHYKDLAARPLDEAHSSLSAGQTLLPPPQEDEDKVRETKNWKQRSFVLGNLLSETQGKARFGELVRSGHSWKALLELELTKRDGTLSYFGQLSKYPADAFLNCAFFKLFSDDPVTAAAMLPRETSLSLVEHSRICAEWAPHLGELNKEWLRSFLKEEVTHSRAIDDLFKLPRPKAMLALQAYDHLTQRGIPFEKLATLDLKVWCLAASTPALCQGLLALYREEVALDLMLNCWSRSPQIGSILERAPQLIRLVKDQRVEDPTSSLQRFDAQSVLMLLNHIEATLSIAPYWPLLNRFELEDEEIAAVLGNPDHAKLLLQCTAADPLNPTADPIFRDYPYRMWRSFPLVSRLHILQHAPTFLRFMGINEGGLYAEMLGMNSPEKLALILTYPDGWIGFTRLHPPEQWRDGRLAQLLREMPIAELQTMLQISDEVVAKLRLRRTFAKT